MAGPAPQLTPAQQQAIRAFQAKYPGVSLSTNLTSDVFNGNERQASQETIARLRSDPDFRSDYHALLQTIGAAGSDGWSGEYFLDNDGSVDRIRDDFWRDIAPGVTAAVLAPLGANWISGAMGPGAAAPTGLQSAQALESATTTGLPAAVGGAAATGTGLGSVLKKIAQAGIPIGTMLATRGLSDGMSDSPGTPGSTGQNGPQLQSLIDLALKRMQDQQPLQDAVNRQALGGLPTYAKQG